MRASVLWGDRMSRFFNSLFMAFSMFSILPTFKYDWNEKDAPLSLIFLPLVGLLIGAILIGLIYLSLNFFKLDLLFLAAIICFLMFFLCGFMHLEGFLDVSDAIFSRREREEKVRILKDPNVGSFAIINLCFVILFSFISIYLILKNNYNSLFFIFLLSFSRCLGSYIAFSSFLMKESSLLAFFKGEKDKYKVISFLLLLITLLLSYSYCFNFFISLICCLLVALILAKKANKAFGGINGDVVGYVIVSSEVVGLIVFALVGGIL